MPTQTPSRSFGLFLLRRKEPEREAWSFAPTVWRKLSNTNRLNPYMYIERKKAHRKVQEQVWLGTGTHPKLAEVGHGHPFYASTRTRLTKGGDRGF